MIRVLSVTKAIVAAAITGGLTYVQTNDAPTIKAFIIGALSGLVVYLVPNKKAATQ